jgi:toluene monooxygenase system protein E
MGPAYKGYVNLQSGPEAKVHDVLEAHPEAGTAADPAEASVAPLGRLFTLSRCLCHGFQQDGAYIGYTAPGPHTTNTAGFSTADFLRRVTTIAYRTTEFQIARPESGIGSAERPLWHEHVTDNGTVQAGRTWRSR